MLSKTENPIALMASWRALRFLGMPLLRADEPHVVIFGKGLWLCEFLCSQGFSGREGC